MKKTKPRDKRGKNISQSNVLKGRPALMTANVYS